MDLTLKEDLQEKMGTITDVETNEVLMIALSKKELKKLAKTSNEEKSKKKNKKNHLPKQKPKQSKKVLINLR